MHLATATIAAVLLLTGVFAPMELAAQPAEKVWRVGEFSLSGSEVANQRWWGIFRNELRELGYVEGRNITFERRFAQGQRDRLPGLAAELVRLNVDVLVVASTEGALAAKRATSTIPIVAVTPSDPVGTGLVASLARPGGNVTGMSLQATDITAKQMAILKEVFPALTRVAVLSNAGNASHPLRLREAEHAARTLKIQLQTVSIRTADDLDQAFAAMVDQRAGALLILADPVFTITLDRVVQLATKHRLLSISLQREHAEAGILISYGVSFTELYRRAAVFVDKIAKGAKPAELPVEQPTRFELVINQRTARTLNVTVPPSLLLRADHIIH